MLDSVVSLEMSPMDDTFLSGARDDTVRLWDLRTANAQGLLNIAGHPCVAYDPSGQVFGVALNLRASILLYDFKNYDKMPFLSVQIDDPILGLKTFPPRIPIFTSLAFSNDGKWLLVGTAGDVHYVVDAYNGEVVARLEGEFTFSAVRMRVLMTECSAAECASSRVGKITAAAVREAYEPCRWYQW
jgi:COMPASS component SWD2